MYLDDIPRYTILINYRSPVQLDVSCPLHHVLSIPVPMSGKQGIKEFNVRGVKVKLSRPCLFSENLEINRRASMFIRAVPFTVYAGIEYLFHESKFSLDTNQGACPESHHTP